MRTLFLFFSLCIFAGSSLTQADEPYTLPFNVIDGSYTYDDVFCVPGTSCEPYTSDLNGTFTATFDYNMRIIESELTLDNGQTFLIEERPPQAIVSYRVNFDGEVLYYSATIDDSASDGPIIEVSLTAIVDGSVAFDADNFYFVKQADISCTPNVTCSHITVRPANRRYMDCGDGDYAQVCNLEFLYVGAMGFSPFIGIDRSTGTELLIRGNIDKLLNREAYILRAIEAFKPVTANPPEGSVVALKSVALENLSANCITAPCENIQEHRINSNYTLAIDRIDLNGTGATAEQEQQARSTLASGGVFLAAGSNKRNWSWTGSSTTFYANQFYLRVRSPLH